MTAQPFIVSRVVTFTYDPLYRLTSTNFNGGNYFTYTYDATGNRLTQVTNSGTTNYIYDNANRLTSAGGVAHAWDNNGDLLSDGTSTYTYDNANRLETVVQGSTTYSFTYNGLGDRLRQTINSTPTTYVVDLNGGLTQVLADRTCISGRNTSPVSGLWPPNVKPTATYSIDAFAISWEEFLEEKLRARVESHRQPCLSGVLGRKDG